MNANGYKQMADEYFSQAEQLKATIKKYESQLDNAKINLEHINSKIAYYRSTRNYLLNIGNELKNKANKISISS